MAASESSRIGCRSEALVVGSKWISLKLRSSAKRPKEGVAHVLVDEVVRDENVLV